MTHSILIKGGVLSECIATCSLFPPMIPWLAVRSRYAAEMFSVSSSRQEWLLHAAIQLGINKKNSGRPTTPAGVFS